MWRLTWKGLISHKLRMGLTAVAIVLGVGLVAGSFVFTDTLSNVFENLFEEGFEDVDVVVRAETDPDLDFALVERIDQSLLTEIEQVEGVEFAAPSLTGFLQLIAPDGELVGGSGAPSFGSNYVVERGPIRLIKGEGPDEPGEIAIDAATAGREDIEVGETVQVLALEAPESFLVTGIIGFGSGENFGGAVFVTFTLEETQRLFDGVGQVDTINITAEPGTQAEALRQSIEPLLPAGVQAVLGETAASEQIEAFQEQLSFFNTFLLVFGMVALFVGAFIIQNTFQIVVAQRTRELGILRALGASRRQITRMVIVEALIVSFLASVVGIGVGVGLALLLQVGLEALGGDLPSGAIQILPRTVTVAIVAGIGITLISALIPALRAGRIPPIEAMREGQQPPAARSLRIRTIIGLVFLSIGAGLGALGLWVNLPDRVPEIAFVGAGAAVMFLGVAILGPTFARPLSNLIGRPLPVLFGVPGKLAKENAARTPRRTSATASALTVGVALASLVTILASSFVAASDDAIDDIFRADLVLQSSAFGGGGIGLAPGVGDTVEQVPEVESATRIRFGQAKYDGSVRSITATDTATFDQAFSFEVLSGSYENVGADGVMLSDSFAESEELQVGDDFTMEFNRTGSTDFEVVALVDSGDEGLDILLDTSGWDRNFIERFDQSVYVRFQPGVPLEDGRQAVELALIGFPGTSVSDQNEFKENTRNSINTLLNLIYGLLALTLVIAVFGIANTLLLSVIERTREIGLLRAVGATRRQLRRMISWESVIIAVFGALLGIAVGILFGWAIVQAIGDISLSLPWVRLIITMVGAGLAGVIAAFFPARRAAKMNVLEAIGYE